MNRQEYLDKRNALYDKAKQLIAENKLAEAREVTQQIDKLDSEFENSAVNMANKMQRRELKCLRHLKITRQTSTLQMRVNR